MDLSIKEKAVVVEPENVIKTNSIYEYITQQEQTIRAMGILINPPWFD